LSIINGELIWGFLKYVITELPGKIGELFQKKAVIRELAIPTIIGTMKSIGQIMQDIVISKKIEGSTGYEYIYHNKGNSRGYRSQLCC